jgi:hypothetical protein
MKKTTYWNKTESQCELSFFISGKSEISFFIDMFDCPSSSISLELEDVKDMIIELQKLVELYERPN